MQCGPDLGPEIDEHEREFIVESNVLNPQEIPGEITTTSLTLQTIFQPSSMSSILFSSLSFPTPEGNVFSFVSPLYSQRTGKCINGNSQYIVIYLFNFFFGLFHSSVSSLRAGTYLISLLYAFPPLQFSSTRPVNIF